METTIKSRERLLKENKELLSLVKEMRTELIELIRDAGGCDHEVGICCCSLYAILLGLDRTILRVEGEG